MENTTGFEKVMDVNDEDMSNDNEKKEGIDFFQNRD